MVAIYIKSNAYRFDLVFQDLSHGLAELLSYEGNVEEDFCTTFQVGKTHSFLFTITPVKHNVFDFTIINTVTAQGKHSTNVMIILGVAGRTRCDQVLQSETRRR